MAVLLPLKPWLISKTNFLPQGNYYFKRRLSTVELHLAYADKNHFRLDFTAYYG